MKKGVRNHFRAFVFADTFAFAALAFARKGDPPPLVPVRPVWPPDLPVFAETSSIAAVSAIAVGFPRWTAIEQPPRAGGGRFVGHYRAPWAGRQLSGEKRSVAHVLVGLRFARPTLRLPLVPPYDTVAKTGIGTNRGSARINADDVFAAIRRYQRSSAFICGSILVALKRPARLIYPRSGGTALRLSHPTTPLAPARVPGVPPAASGGANTTGRPAGIDAPRGIR